MRSSLFRATSQAKRESVPGYQMPVAAGGSRMSMQNGTFYERLEDGVATAREVEAYIAGAYELLLSMGADGHGKSYDPMIVDEEKMVAHSYVLNLWDGGRHHDYESLKQIVRTALLEFSVEARGLFRTYHGDDWEVPKSFRVIPDWVVNDADNRAVESLKRDMPEVFKATIVVDGIRVPQYRALAETLAHGTEPSDSEPKASSTGEDGRSQEEAADGGKAVMEGDE
jgi:hypothetical protein